MNQFFTDVADIVELHIDPRGTPESGQCFL